MTIPDVIRYAIDPALSLLPARMDSRAARAQMLATGLQESRLQHRDQIDPQRLNGPALGLWQFERGTPVSRGGITGIMLHPATSGLLSEITRRLDYPWDANYLWLAIEYDIMFGAVCARLLIWTVPRGLPTGPADFEEGWRQYAYETWRPGKPHPETWREFFELAWSAV